MLVWTCLITNSDKKTKKSMKKDFSFKSSSATVQVRRNTDPGIFKSKKGHQNTLILDFY